LYCLSLDVRLLITPLVSSNVSFFSSFMFTTWTMTCAPSHWYYTPNSGIYRQLSVDIFFVISANLWLKCRVFESLVEEINDYRHLRYEFDSYSWRYVLNAINISLSVTSGKYLCGFLWLLRFPPTTTKMSLVIQLCLLFNCKNDTFMV
jgi:hypothetical protein